MGKMILNVIHRADRGAESREALDFQQSEAHRFGFRTSILLTYNAMLDPEMTAYVKEQRDVYGDELGIHFHEMMCDEFVEQFGIKEGALYLCSMEIKKRVISHMFERFKELFGYYPMAVGAYILDAATMNFIKARYPGVKAAITNCFEEGVNMYQGNAHSWVLFSDGGPWGVYYPSKANHLIPAADESDDIGIVGLPHLNRDMLLSLTSRDDLFASHPLNLLRAKANEAGECTYMYRFIDLWIEQARYNGFSYYSYFVSSPWVMAGKTHYESDWEDARSLYSASLEYLSLKEQEGYVRTMTMTEVALWYRENIKIGKPEINLWKDILWGSKRKMFWHIDSGMRVAIDPNIGGSICDLRPYAGRPELNLGPDTDQLWNGNFPFTVSTAHRGGGQNCIISVNGNKDSTYNYRTGCSIVKSENGASSLVLYPIDFNISGVKVSLQTVYTFPQTGVIQIERKVIDISDPDALITLTESHCGTLGTTEYPENMKGILLEAFNSAECKETEIAYEYLTRSYSTSTSGYVRASIPKLNACITLKPQKDADYASFEEGKLFWPFYLLEVHKKIKKGGSLITWLMIEKKL